VRIAPGQGIAAAALVGFLVGCRTIEATRGVPPFYEVYDTPSSIGSVAGAETFFRPLGSFESLRNDRSTAAPQVAASRLRTSQDAGPRPRATGSHLRFLSPFFDFHWGPDGERYAVLPIYLYRNYPSARSGNDVDWMVLPFFFGGHDEVEGDYFAFFPFGGCLKGLLAHDETWFWFFPAYWTWRDRQRESTHVVWPFFNSVSGVNEWKGEESGWRLWPFYGRYQSRTAQGQLRYDRGFALWPFYIRHKDQVNVNPTNLFFSLPFYGERTNSRTETYVYLWPFFGTYYDRRYDRKLYFGYLLPYRFTDGQFDLWPLFGRKKTSRGTDIAGVVRRTYRHYHLWPFERYEWATDGFEETVRFWILPLVWHFYYIDKDTLETESEWTLWPLFRLRSVGQKTSFDLFSLLWFRREDYDRLYSRWFNVFRYRWSPEISGWEIIYGAVMYLEEPARSTHVFSVLGGLFECGSREGRSSFRLLYVPWW
jgi:hypothetical protein